MTCATGEDVTISPRMFIRPLLFYHVCYTPRRKGVQRGIPDRLNSLDIKPLTEVISKTSFSLKLFLPLDKAIASRAVFVIVSGSDGRAGGNAFRAS